MNGISASLEGLKRAESQITESAKRVAKLPAAFTDLLSRTGGGAEAGAPVDVVDLSAESVALLQARNAAEANLAAIDTYDQVQAQILSIFQ